MNTAHATDQTLNISMQLFSPSLISSQSTFKQHHVNVGQSDSAVITDNSHQVAIIFASGQTDQEVVGSIVENKIIYHEIDNSNKQYIIVGHFTFGGDMTASGHARFPASGRLHNLRVESTIHTSKINHVKNHIGKTTFRLVHW